MDTIGGKSFAKFHWLDLEQTWRALGRVESFETGRKGKREREKEREGEWKRTRIPDSLFKYTSMEPKKFLKSANGSVNCSSLFERCCNGRRTITAPGQGWRGLNINFAPIPVTIINLTIFGF